MRRIPTKVLATTTALLLASATFTGTAGAAEEPTVIANGLDNPRGLAWAADGSLLVAEAGRGGDGPCIPGAEGDDVCFGLSGAITRISGGDQERIVTGLPSLATAEGGSASGPEDVSVDHGTGETFVLTGLGQNPAARDGLPPEAAALGALHRVGPNGPEIVADLAAYEAANDPDAGLPGTSPDSNPKGMLAVYGQQLMVDAGGNTLLHRGVDGRLSTLAVFPVTLIDAPPFLGAPPGTQIPSQGVPTTVALAPDGSVYVSQLTGFPFPTGGATIYKWLPGGALEPVATGFTNVIDMAIGPDGSIYVLEIAKNSLLAATDGGRLIRIAPDGSRSTFAEEGLFFPTSVAVDDAGSVYVSNCGVCAGRGEVWKY